MEVGNFFFQIIQFLLAIIFGIWGQILPKGHLKILLYILMVILITVSSAGVGYKYGIRQTTSGISQPTSPPTLVPTLAPIITEAPASTVISQYQGWVICWHGRAAHEFLIAYPEVNALNGINLNPLPFQYPWDSSTTDNLANDSLKMCFYNGSWYGDLSAPWFPSVTYLRLLNNQIVVCDEASTCEEQQWTFTPSNNSPPAMVVALLNQPSGTEIQILGYISSEDLP